MWQPGTEGFNLQLLFAGLSSHIIVRILLQLIIATGEV
jgi:hypothetical protein